ncbi:MAG: pantetheine-phosphate adenylyltransferase [Acidobacteriota bacterium]
MTRLAICPGSFDPITNGHVDVIERARRIFDEVIVAILVNPGKSGLFTVAERRDMIGRAVPALKVEEFSGLLVDYARAKGAVAIVRGLRGVGDFDYELQMAQMNRSVAPGVETVFLMCDPRYAFVSSRLVKEVASMKGSVRALVPDHVATALERKYGP